jgi:hypothetical protein
MPGYWQNLIDKVKEAINPEQSAPVAPDNSSRYLDVHRSGGASVGRYLLFCLPASSTFAGGVLAATCQRDGRRRPQQFTP